MHADLVETSKKPCCTTLYKHEDFVRVAWISREYKKNKIFQNSWFRIKNINKKKFIVAESKEKYLVKLY